MESILGFGGGWPLPSSGKASKTMHMARAALAKCLMGVACYIGLGQSIPLWTMDLRAQLVVLCI